MGSCQHALLQAGGDTWKLESQHFILQRVYKCAQPTNFPSTSIFCTIRLQKPGEKSARNSLLLTLKIVVANKILTSTNLY